MHKNLPKNAGDAVKVKKNGNFFYAALTHVGIRLRERGI